MKSLKTLLSLSLTVIFLSVNLITAQEKEELDKIPMPVGGMETILKNVVYPTDAKKAGSEGKVFVKAIVDENGTVTETLIEKGDNKLLNEAAEKAVKATKFTAGEKDGKKVKSEIVVPIVFRLK